MIMTVGPQAVENITKDCEYIKRLSMIRREGLSLLTVFFFERVEVISMGN